MLPPRGPVGMLRLSSAMPSMRRVVSSQYDDDWYAANKSTGALGSGREGVARSSSPDS